MHLLAYRRYRWRCPSLFGVVALASCIVWAPAASAQLGEDEADPAALPAVAADESSVASLFEDFLHFARLGKFQEARAFATTLLEQPDLDPVELLAIADRDRKSLNTLITVINNSSIGEEARRVLDVLHEGEHLRRQDPERINVNIEKLTGPPQTEYNAIQNLIDSGEYAVPWMVQALMDQGRQRLWPRIIRTLPQIGQPAVNPLVVVLEERDRNLRQNVIHALGDLGYAYAVPYLKKLLASEDIEEDTRAAAEQALTKIARRTGCRFRASGADEFIALGEQYYDEQGSLRADVRASSANIWYWRDGFVQAVVVPRDIYGPIMAMRCAEEALLLDPGRAEAIALWLAADIRREARLGLDVESGEVVEEELDATRPPGFPRAIYFARAAGARYCLDVLDRANRDQDTPVALGAIAALQTVAGATSLVEFRGAGQPLVQALQFPDAVVRIKAAIALAEARPKSGFPGVEWGVPALAEALLNTGAQRFVVIDPDRENLNRVMDFLRAGGVEVLGGNDFYTTLERARREFRSVSGMFISSAIKNPGVREGVEDLRREFLFRMTPVVLIRGAREYETAGNLAQHDLLVAHIGADAEGDELLEAMRDVMTRSGRMLSNPDQALELALAAADAILGLSLDGQTVLNVAAAEPALLSVLREAQDEELRTRAVLVLASLPTQSSQRALAEVALEDGQSETLRVAAFAGLADSAKTNGNRLTDTLLSRLVKAATDEPDLTLRTAASRALGALNLTDNKASEIIRKYYRG